MVVHANRMRENLELTGGLVFSGTVLLELARRGVTREDAYAWVQRNAMRARDERLDFKTLLAADPEIAAVLPPAEINRAFDLNEQFRYVDQIFDRVFSAAPFPDGSGSAEPAETLGSSRSRH
jgi:adenylosuccinate lyase